MMNTNDKIFIKPVQTHPPFLFHQNEVNFFPRPDKATTMTRRKHKKEFQLQYLLKSLCSIIFKHEIEMVYDSTIS